MTMFNSKNAILNLTQHSSTPEQQAQGVFDLQGSDLALLKQLLNFEQLPDRWEVGTRAESLIALARKYEWKRVMLGGAPYLMGPLERALEARGLEYCYAFSTRESVEKVVDGKIIKTSVFKHRGFI